VEFVEQYWQTIAVGLCIAGALLFLARAGYHRFAGKSDQSCGGCGSCGASRHAGSAQASKIAQLVQIDIKKKTLPS
jgi:hypothetical protein